MHSASTDKELHAWLVWADENGDSFLQLITQAATVADIRHYLLLRPVSIELKRMYPENSWVLPSDARVGRPEH
jgi:hypothetical protein